MTRDTPCADALRWLEVRGAVEIQVGSLENPVGSVGEVRDKTTRRPEGHNAAMSYELRDESDMRSRTQRNPDQPCYVESDQPIEMSGSVGVAASVTRSYVRPP